MQADRKGAAKADGREAPVVHLTRHQPSTLVALHAPGSTHITLDLCLLHPHAKDASNPYVVKSMARETNEEAQKVLDRIRLLFQPPPTKGGSVHRKQKEARVSKEDLLAACPPLRVLGDPSLASANAPAREKAEEEYVVLDTSLPQSVFWKCAKVLFIGDVRNTVRYNIPTITSLVPPTAPVVGVPTVCSNVTTLFMSEKAMSYEWGLREEDGTLTVLSRDSVFTATDDLLGRSVVLRLAPDAAAGLWAEAVLAPVKPSPPPVKRWEQTREFLAAPDLRVVSYNILFEDFCTGKPFCRNRIYPFASDEVLAIDTRKVRILQELLAYHADLIGLQECGKRLFRDYLQPSLRSQGYEAVYANKSGTVQEGCAFAFRRERLELLSSESFPLSWATLEKEHPAVATVIAMSHPELREALESITSIGFIARLRERATGIGRSVGRTKRPPPFFLPMTKWTYSVINFVLMYAIRKLLRCSSSEPNNI
ncbi:2',5'-phosphodiesterase [Strigomonas culicis]|uniref:2',5'-phosphodiesterase n=1 Tax=Strigomonas culicis TaxID=28005 RepID=S9TPL1_9TRYP|nr:2',5'-phosphodiesterase [Strigomonas culicis]|eukprot:EPY20232.1 2',5'-phosphodiesterase [Strigomonas culicis]